MAESKIYTGLLDGGWYCRVCGKEAVGICGECREKIDRPDPGRLERAAGKADMAHRTDIEKAYDKGYETGLVREANITIEGTWGEGTETGRDKSATIWQRIKAYFTQSTRNG